MDTLLLFSYQPYIPFLHLNMENDAAARSDSDRAKQDRDEPEDQDACCNICTDKLAPVSFFNQEQTLNTADMNPFFVPSRVQHAKIL